MNFNLDDPLADLLSDNSNDNDSFFDNQPGKKKIISKPPARTSGGKGKMEDLFGIKEESEPQFKVPPIRTNFMSGKKEEKPLAASTPKVKPKVVAENVDIFSDLGFDPKNPKSTVASKSNLFDDILSSIDSKKPSQSAVKNEELSIRRDDVVSASTRGTISRQSTETTENSAILGPARPKTSTGRRPSTASPAKINTFDLFSRENDVLRVPTPKKSRKKGSTADWLGLGNESEEEPSNAEVLKIPENLPKAEVLKINEEVEAEVEIVTVPDLEPVAASISLPINTPVLPHHLMTTANIGTQNAAQIIDQQVTQLTLASQMKNQEAALMEMQRRQYDLISRQESQFNELLQKQVSRQNQLEQSIKAQQERINAHIQFLLSQPVSNDFLVKEDLQNEENKPNLQEKSEAFIDLQADVRRLELEKLRLEDLVSTINANYEKEIELIERSFRKQIEVLEDHLATVETRLKNENSTLHEFYNNKLQIVNNERIDMQSRLEGYLSELRKSHEEDIRRLKTTHEEDMDGLKDDHRRMIETIRQSKLFEFAAVQENGSYLETLRMASTNLESVTGDLQSLRSEMEQKIDNIHRERQMRLDNREKKLEDSERRIQLIENSNEEEKTRLMTLVTTLESQLKQLSKDSSEENWIMRQNMSALEAEKINFEKEKTLIREQMAKDEKRIEELKEKQLLETQRQMQQIHEERIQLGVEKAKIETTKKLESSTSLEQSRQEVEASLKVAQDVTRQAEAERERFFKLQRQLEIQKRTLVDRENEIRFKVQELEQDILQARGSERRANEATQKARSIEQNFDEKVTFLQQKLRELSEKESRLSQERLKLSQERIDLQNLRSKLDQNRCSLCRIGERNGELSQVLRPNNNNGIPMIDDQYFVERHQRSSNDVDRFLDENVTISLERLKNTSNRSWNEQERMVEATRPNSNGDQSLLDFDLSKFVPTNDFLGN